MVRIEVVGLDKVRAQLKAMATDVQAKALRPALNKVAAKASAEISRAIPQEFAVKTSEVRSAVSVRPATGSKLEAVVEIFGSSRKKGRSLNLIHFLASVAGKKTRGSKAKASDIKALQQQLGFLIKRGGSLKQVKGAFVGNNGRTIFERVGKERLPIKPVQVIGYSQMFNSRRINQRVIKKVREEMPIELERAVAMLKGRGLA